MQVGHEISHVDIWALVAALKKQAEFNLQGSEHTWAPW